MLLAGPPTDGIRMVPELTLSTHAACCPVYQFPDGKIEIRAAGEKVPYSTYDKLGAIDQGAIVENRAEAAPSL
jgi:hypothetical protein